ncbi:MAG: hypothetical protein WCR21_10120, partial [Bacteroidota bacterium]
SMRSIIEDVKHAAMNFHDDLAMVMNQKEKSIGNLRVRVVAYRDYLDRFRYYADAMGRNYTIRLTVPFNTNFHKPLKVN